MNHEPALNVVVYPQPGPDEPIEKHAYDVLVRKNVSGTGGGLGYLVLVAADFERLWAGVNNGDALGTAAAVLHHLGGGARHFIGRSEDFIYGWVGDDDPQEGRTLLLQVVPRPHMRAPGRAEMN
jgi:hypothetical protein